MGQKRRTPSKPSQSDFSQSKSRVGQKNRLAANQTQAEVRVKPVKVGEQRNITRYESKGPIVTSRNLTLEEVMGQTNHHNVNTRREAFVCIKELLDKFPTALSSQLGYLLTTLIKGLVDSDEIVRKHFRSIVEKIMLLLTDIDATDSLTSSQRLLPFANRLGCQLRSCMTHRDANIRSDAVPFVEFLVGHQPSDQMLMKQIIVACVKGSEINATTTTTTTAQHSYFETVSMFLDDLYSRCLPNGICPRNMARLWKIGRIGLQLLQLPTGEMKHCNKNHSNNKLDLLHCQKSLMSIINLEIQSSQNKEAAGSPQHLSQEVQTELRSGNRKPTRHSVIKFLRGLADMCSQISARMDLTSSALTNPQLGGGRSKILSDNESVLRQIISEFGSSQHVPSECPSSKISFSCADEFFLISLSSQLDMMLLMLRCLDYLNQSSVECPDVINEFSLNQSFGSSQRGGQVCWKLIHEIILPRMKATPICPIRVNKSVYHSMTEQLSILTIRMISSILSIQGPIDFPNVQTSIMLLGLYSEAIVKLSQVLTLKNSLRECNKTIRSLLSTFSSLLKSIPQASTCSLLNKIIHVVSTSCTTTALKESSDENRQSRLQWKKFIDTALKKCNNDQWSSCSIHKKKLNSVNNFTLLLSKQANDGSSSDDQSDDAMRKTEGETSKNILFILKSLEVVSIEEMNDLITLQISSTFDKLWKDLSPETGSNESTSELSPKEIVKRRKLSIGGDFASINCNESPLSDDEQTSESVQNKTDYRICLVPFFSSCFGFPSPNIPSLLPNTLCLRLFKFSLKENENLMGQTRLQIFDSKHLNKLIKKEWLIDCVKLAANYSEDCPEVSDYLFTILLSLYHHTSQMLTDKLLCDDLLHQIMCSYFSSDLIIKSNYYLKRNLYILLSHLVLKQFKENDFSLVHQLMNVVEVEDDILSLFIDLILTSDCIGVHQKIKFCQQIALKGQKPNLLTFCMSHKNRLKWDLEMELKENAFLDQKLSSTQLIPSI